MRVASREFSNSAAEDLVADFQSRVLRVIVANFQKSGEEKNGIRFVRRGKYLGLAGGGLIDPHGARERARTLPSTAEVGEFPGRVSGIEIADESRFGIARAVELLVEGLDVAARDRVDGRGTFVQRRYVAEVSLRIR